MRVADHATPAILFGILLLQALAIRVLLKMHLDVLHATIDLHKRLVEIAQVMRTVLLPPPAHQAPPSPAEAVGEHAHQETPEEWLARVSKGRRR